MSGASFHTFAVLMQVMKEARHAPDTTAFGFVTVNRTHALFAYQQAILFKRLDDGRLRVEALSHLDHVDRNTPLVRWFERIVHEVAVQHPGTAPLALTAATVPESERMAWDEWCAPHALWCPLPGPGGLPEGGLWLARVEPWTEDERLLMEHLADTYGHAFAALQRRQSPRRGLRRHLKHSVAWGLGIALLTLLFPVRQSVLAPAEVIARTPLVVSAPLAGVVAELAVRPNAEVKAGDALLRFDDTEFRARYEVAEKALATAQAELLQASQGAFHDARQKGNVGVLRAQIEMRSAERDYAAEQLARTVVYAERDGVAVYSDPNDWIGRPVTVGERILLLADPRATELRAEVPVADAITLEPGAPVVLFLETEPLTPYDARLLRAAFEAEPTAGGLLAYPAFAEFHGQRTPPRLGLRGIAKLYGPRVPLAYQLLRRPLGAARAWLGL